jgi:hypothetical protein
MPVSLAHFLQMSSLQRIFIYKKNIFSSLHGLANRVANIRDGGKLSRRLLNVSIKKYKLSSLHGLAA